ncbi:MAG: tRNA (N(6)-L-threonylcarbamoyladenosine(37)-C(2))-methylthiotransferase MtaB [Bryobacterales bacterium]|nr:tRNA (N(6)-L-threonylcarbamoyladenosine(37)-C(2))-methylthiotransferase MtaB [Bryobacterales bacterium]
MGRFLVQNFGCRATQADGAALASALEGSGHAPVESTGNADIVILNTCTVTAAADDDVRQTVRRVHRENPNANILITGCYAQRAPAELASLPGVRWVVGNSHKTTIPDILHDANASVDFHGEIHVGDIFAQQEFLSAPVEDGGDRSRPNLKIQDGCNNICTFCIIPHVRGRSRSATPEQVIDQVRALAGRYPEIVLSGINLGRWGRDAGRPFGFRLAGLIRRLLDETPVQRLRLSSIEPMDFSDDLLELMASSPRIAKHVHAPLQSGSDSVLKRMKRRYRIRHYADRLARARALMPKAAIGADVMVGFPGETEAEFEETYGFIEQQSFAYLHVFTYSERPGTPAAAERTQIPIPVRKRRNRLLRELGARKNAEFRSSLLGQPLSVVTLDRPLSALSDNFIPIELATPRPPNQVVTVYPDALSEKGLRERNPLRVLAG